MRAEATASAGGGFARGVGGALAAALAVRALLFCVRFDPFLNPDSFAFRDLAHGLATTGRLAYVDQGAPGVVLRAFRSLLYPVFLRGLGGVAPGVSAWAPVFVVQSLLGVGVIALVADVARQAWGPRVGLVSAWIGALYVTSVYFERQVTSEALFAPLLALAVWLVARAGDRPWPALLSGLAFGLAAWTRPAGLVAGGFAGLALLAAARLARPRGVARAARPVLALGLGVALALAPGVWRNERVLGTATLQTSGGMNFWIGNGRGSVGDAWAVMARELPRRGEVGMDRWFYADTWGQREAIARDLPRALARKAWEFASPLAREAWYLPYRFLWPFALVGVILAARSAWSGPKAARAGLVLAAVLLSQVLLALATVPWARYRFPVEPLLWPLAALALVRLAHGGARGRLALGAIALGNGGLLVAQVLR